MNLFDRLAKHRPTPPKEKTKQQPMEQAQALLNWLQRRPGDTITARDIRIWGPKILHDKERAIRSAQILAAQGHLIPLAAHKWQIVRELLISTKTTG